jgi:hypothetical protein
MSLIPFLQCNTRRTVRAEEYNFEYVELFPVCGAVKKTTWGYIEKDEAKFKSALARIIVSVQFLWISDDYANWFERAGPSIPHRLLPASRSQ